MDVALPIALVGVVLAIAIAIGVLAWRAEQTRRRALASWARAHGWSYVGSDPSWVDRLAGPPFGKGRRRRAENVLSGTHAKLASDVLPPRIMEQLLAAAPTDWRLQDGYAVAWSDVRLNLVELTDKLSVLGLVVAGVPRFVWRRHGYDPVSSA